MRLTRPRIAFGAWNPVTVWCSGSFVGRHAHQELATALQLATAIGRAGDVIYICMLGVDQLDWLCSARLGWAAMEADEKGVRFRVQATAQAVIDAITELVGDVGANFVSRPPTSRGRPICDTLDGQGWQ